MTGSFCECGCGASTSVATVTNPRFGHIKGEPMRFINGHNRRRYGAPYRRVKTIVGLQQIHRVRAELALGRPLPLSAVVHHADGSKSENAPLVICENQGYHRLLHARMRVVAHGGNPNTDAVCCRCHLAKPREHFTLKKQNVFGVAAICRECAADGWFRKNETASWRQRKYGPRASIRARWFKESAPCR